MELQIETNCPTTWKFEYESDNPALDNLYEIAKRDQWNVSVDIDWEQNIREDSDVFARGKQVSPKPSSSVNSVRPPRVMCWPI